MNYRDALEKLEWLRTKWHDQDRDIWEKKCMIYGELEELLNRFVGIDQIVVQPTSTTKTVYPNYIAAELLSGQSFYRHEAYTQLLQVIGKVGRYAEDPTVPQVEHSVTHLIQVLRRFRECCQYLTEPPQEEKDVQNILWITLRSHFDRLERHNTLPGFGAKSYVPDFGIPDLRILIEAKFIGPKTKVGNIQEEILADIPGYLNDPTGYDSVIVFVYDAAHKLRDPAKFIEDLKSVEGIIDVIVIPGIA